MPSKRVSLTIQFAPEKDRKLIGEIRKLTNGKRNGEIKEKLLLGFGIQPDTTVQEIAELRREIAELREIVSSLPAQLKAMLGNIKIEAGTLHPEPDDQRISDDEIAKRAANLKKRSW